MRPSPAGAERAHAGRNPKGKIMPKKKIEPDATTSEANTPAWGGLPVKVVEPEATVVAEVEIADTEAEQKAIAVKPEGEPAVNHRGIKRPLPVGATQAAPGASSSRSTRRSKKKGSTNTVRDKATTTAPTKAKGTKPKTAAKKLDRTLTIGELAGNFQHHLEVAGKSRGTVFSYGIELKTAVKHFGAETKVTSLTVKKVQEYFDSDAVTKNRKGGAKDEKTVAKTRRVFRQALLWLAEVGVLEAAPISETKKSDKSKK